jgi:hypothetical protein
VGPAFLVLLGVLAARAGDGPVRLEVKPAKTEVTVGEAFTVTVEARGPAGATYAFPAELVQEQVELHATPAAPTTGAPDARTTGGPAPEAQAYVASVFGLGEVEIPPLAVRYRLADGSEGEARSAAVKLKVGTLLPKDAKEQKLADIRGPVDLTIGRAFWIALAAGILLLAALLYWLARRRRKAVAPETAPLPEGAPDEEALRALERLVASGALLRGEMRPFYIALTAIAKHYLERRLGAPIQEMTSAEMVAFLRDHPVGGEMAQPLRDVSSAADGVKFARGEGLVAEAERHLAAVTALVRSVEARLKAAEPKAPGRVA